MASCPYLYYAALALAVASIAASLARILGGGRRWRRSGGSAARTG